MVDLTSDSKKTQEFEVFDSIIHGELRPFLSKYSSKETIEKLIHDLNHISIIKTIDGGWVGATEKDKKRLADLVSEGEQLIFEFDEKDPNSVGTFKRESDEKLEPLIDIDIPPPPDKKAEYFLSIIEDEYDEIKKQAQIIFDESDSPENARFIAEKRIVQLKKLASQAHRLWKQIPSKGKNITDDADLFVIYVLKTYLIRSIAFYEDLFQPFIKIPILNEHELRTALYEADSVETIRRRWDDIEWNSFYKGLGQEIKALDPDFGDHTVQYIENYILDESWGKKAIQQAILNGFIGKSHLIQVLAVDNYLCDSNYFQLTKTFTYEFMKKPYGYTGPSENHPKEISTRKRMWRTILSRWTEGNFPNLDNKISNMKYIPFYSYDVGKKCLYKMPLREMLIDSEKRASAFFKSKPRPYDLNKYQEFFAPHMKAPKFIKLEDLRSFFQNDVGLPLPLSLFPNENKSDSLETLKKKLRPSQQARLKCRKIAAAKWNEKHNVTISDMIYDDEIASAATKKDGSNYSEKTVRDWIKDLCPNRSPGRPSKANQ